MHSQMLVIAALLTTLAMAMFFITFPLTHDSERDGEPIPRH